MIEFLMNAGHPLPDGVMHALYNAAKDMAKSRKCRRTLNEPGYSGVVTTSWKTGSMGSISGVEFRAEMDTPFGENIVTFIVRSYELEDEEWTGINSSSPEEAEMMSEMSRRPRGRLH
ncbi:MAG TPA: hypothetical protein VGP13_02965 [Candidatus Paceibacterota bacterium]|jgi:hypothetical protein|nr:hypothetical protein [Candidatus Paceibacterota bacterium]